jgi:hypothetical protein
MSAPTRQALTALFLSLAAVRSQATVLQDWTCIALSERFAALAEPVPEPASTALLLCGLLCMAALERRRVHERLWLRLKAGLRHSLGWLSFRASS